MGNSKSTESQEKEQRKETVVSRGGRCILETREDIGSPLATTAAVVVAGLALWGLWTLCRRDNQTMMRAPGRRGEYIIRDVFESDPKAYFASLRNE